MLPAVGAHEDALGEYSALEGTEDLVLGRSLVETEIRIECVRGEEPSMGG